VREPVRIGGPAERGPDQEELLGQVARGGQEAFGPVHDAVAGPVLATVRPDAHAQARRAGQQADAVTRVLVAPGARATAGGGSKHPATAPIALLKFSSV
jgi:RNA polymerase sigma-70 factor (ECF subfamily)